MSLSSLMRLISFGRLVDRFVKGFAVSVNCSRSRQSVISSSFTDLNFGWKCAVLTRTLPFLPGEAALGSSGGAAMGMISGWPKK